MLAHGAAGAASAWAWHPHPEAWLLVLGLAGAYLLALRRLGPRHAPGRPPATPGQRAAFLLGVAAVWVAIDGPVHEVAEGYWFSMHMVQHLLLMMVAPGLLLLGTPAWLAGALLRPRPVLALVRFVGRPVPALLAFNGVLVLTHWPEFLEVQLGTPILHAGTHLALIAAGIVLWLPVGSPTLAVPRLSYPGQMMYLFAQSLVPTVPASFFTFGSEPLVEAYVTAPRLLGVSALTDMRLAGLIMKIVGGLILWTVIAVLFFRWFQVESRDGVDVLEHRDVDRMLNRVELKR